MPTSIKFKVNISKQVLPLLFVIGASLAIILFDSFEARRLTELTLEGDVKQLGQIASLENERLIADVHQVLILLSSDARIRVGGSTCSQFLADLLKQYTRYVNFGVTDLEGNVICSAVTPTGPVNLSDRTYFQEAVKTKSLAVGNYSVNRITGTATVSFGYPILDSGHNVTSVVFVSLDLGWLNKLVEEIPLRQEMTLTMVDRNGVVLVRQPDPERWVGTTVLSSPLVQAMLTKKEGSGEYKGLDGIRRFYDFRPLAYGAEPSAFIAVGASKKADYSRTDTVMVVDLAILAFFSVWALGRLKAKKE